MTATLIRTAEMLGPTAVHYLSGPQRVGGVGAFTGPWEHIHGLHPLEPTPAGRWRFCGQVRAQLYRPRLESGAFPDGGTAQDYSTIKIALFAGDAMVEGSEISAVGSNNGQWAIATVFPDWLVDLDAAAQLDVRAQVLVVAVSSFDGAQVSYGLAGGDHGCSWMRLEPVTP